MLLGGDSQCGSSSRGFGLELEMKKNRSCRRDEEDAPTTNLDGISRLLLRCEEMFCLAAEQARLQKWNYCCWSLVLFSFQPLGGCGSSPVEGGRSWHFSLKGVIVAELLAYQTNRQLGLTIHGKTRTSPASLFPFPSTSILLQSIYFYTLHASWSV